MIKIKLASIRNQPPQELPCVPGETLFCAVDRSVGHLVLDGRKIQETFQALVNGHRIDFEMWENVKLSEADSVLICPILHSGDSGSLIKLAVVIAVTAYAGPALATYLGAGSVGAAFITAGVTIATSLLMNGLIPPPVPEGLDIGAGGDVAGSQMYSVSGQSNQVKKLAVVPKVYGKHRIFPPVAASPYVEIETDPDTGNIVQYFYCVYDLGLGPMTVEQVQIGDTPITNFSDVIYRLVDFNKPLVSEGIWDDALESDLLYYKGDVEQDPTSVALNKNQSPSNAVEDYQATRNAATNTSSVAQEISVTLTNPNGLYAFNASGERGPRSIEVDVMFSKVGEDSWKGFNDPAFVSHFVSTGGDEYFKRNPADLIPTGLNPLTYYSQTVPTSLILRKQLQYGLSAPPFYEATRYYGLPKGATTIILATISNPIGLVLRLNGEVLGKITAEAVHSPGYKTYTFDTPTTKPISIFRIVTVEDGYGAETSWPLNPNWGTEHSDTVTSNKITWERISYGRAKITRSELGPVVSLFKFTPKEIGNYKVRVTRVNSYSSYSQTIQDSMVWNGLASRFDRGPIITDKRHVFLELKIRATNQLSGNIQNLSAVCTSVLDVYDGVSWSKQPSSNPAWVFADLLTGEINKRSLDKTRLDTASLLEWAAFCDQVPTPPPSLDFFLPRFQTNLVMDYAPTLQSALNQVTGSAQASLNIINGKYGVLIDKLKTVPVQIFTPRNCSNFSSSRNYTSQPHAVKVSYIDPSANWEAREVVVYDTGYTEDNATQIDEVASFGATNMEQAWRLGRYMMAQNRLRQETISITVDFENLVCTRGDYVQITQDVMKVGGSPARVKSISGNQIVIDDAIETGPGSYGFVFRGADGSIETNTLTVVNSTTFDLAGGIYPAVGDLVIIGLVGNIVIDCLVKSIEPGSDLSAVLTLVEKADAIYDAESTDTLPDYLPQISPTANADYAPPGEVVDLVVSDYVYECNGTQLEYFITTDWDYPTGAATDIFEVWVDSGRGYNLFTTTKQTFYTYQVDRDDLDLTHNFKIIAVSATGKKLDLGVVGSVSQVATRKSTPPEDVSNLNIDITGEVLQLFWDRVADCSCREYLIRYSPDLAGTWERSIPLMRVDSKLSLAAAQARTGIYLIKAVDFEGNESLTASAAITTIPELFNLNIIDETTDFPALPGAKDRVETDVAGLVLKQSVIGDVDTTEYYSEGYYYYENFLDLGEIYSVRLQSLIQAEGFSLLDLMSNWVTLDDVDTMYHAGFSDWDVEAQYRTTDTLNVMSDWATLSSINPISEGAQESWTSWKKFLVGDATGRIFQFRLKLISNKVSVTPRVFDGTIKADMPDRVESFDNILASSSGQAVTYTPSFKGPGSSPNIQISIDGASSGDYWTFDYRTLDGFYIRFWDKNNVAVARTFDAQIKGFGRKATAVI